MDRRILQIGPPNEIPIMQTAINLWPLLGVLVIIIGFVLRFNPMLVVALAAVATGFAASMPLDTILATIGTGFIKTRNLPLIILLPLAVIGLLERHGLRQHAQRWISSIKSATSGRLLIVYLGARQLTAAVGLDRKSTRLNSSHSAVSRMPSSA